MDNLDQLLKARLAKANRKVGRKSVAIPRRSPDIDYLPLSSGQSRLWYLNQVEPDSAVYNLVEVNRLQGELEHTPSPGGELGGTQEIVRVRHARPQLV